MNITSINVNTGIPSVSEDSANQTGLEGFTEGQTIEGIISKVSDMVSITFNDQEIQVPRSAVQNAKEGQIRRFEIKDVSEKSIVLKEVGDSAGTTSKLICTKVETDQTAFIASMKEDLADSTAKEKAKSTNQMLLHISETMSENDYAELDEESSELEKYKAERLEKALVRVKEKRQFRRKHLENQVQDLQQRKANVEKISNQKYDDAIVQKLQDSDIPVTEENIQRISMALHMSESVVNLSDYSMKYMIDKNIEPTINHIYKSSYTGNNKRGSYSAYAKQTAGYSASDEAWTQVKDQVQNILTKSGYEVNNQNMANAKWLFDRELPINESTLNQLEQLQTMKQNYNKEDVLDQIINQLIAEGSPEQTNLAIPSYEDAVDLVAAVGTITDASIAWVVDKSEPVTLGKLLAANVEENAAVSFTSIEEITAKRQVEEIRLKLTVENAYKLLKQGIQVDTSSLESVIDQLKQIEQDYYAGLLNEQGAIVSDQNIAMLSDTTYMIEQLKTSPCAVLGHTLQIGMSQVLSDLYETSNEVRADYEKANRSYEQLLTTPDTKYGDSITKAFQNVDDILEDLGLKNTLENQRAVRILGYNNMEITVDNINETKSYDAQVNYLLSNLHPAMTVSLIKEGWNPVDSTIEQLNEKITKMKDSIDLSEDSSYSKYLYKLDKQEGLTEEEREAYIGIYRLLHQVEQSDGAAIGSVLQADKEMTLSNLLTAVRTKKSGGINKQVNNDTVQTQEIKDYVNSITSQLAASFDMEADSKKGDHSSEYESMKRYATHLIQNLKSNLSPEALQQLQGDELLQKTVEELNDVVMENQTFDSEFEKEMVERIRQLSAKDNMETIQMLNANGLEVSIANLSSANYMLENNKDYYNSVKKMFSKNTEGKKDFDKIANQIFDSMDEEEKLDQQMEQLGEQANEIVREQVNNQVLSYEELSQLRLIGNSMSLITAMSRNRQYEIPVMVGDQVSTMRVSIQHNQNETGQIQIHTQSEQLGEVYMELSVQEDGLKGMVVCSDMAGYELLGQSKEAFIKQIEETGTVVKDINYNKNKLSHLAGKVGKKEEKEENSNVSTKQLYKVAKVCVACIRNIEQQFTSNGKA